MEKRFNSGLRIKIPTKKDIECSRAKMARMEKKAPPGWEVRKDRETGHCYYYNPTTNNHEVYTPVVEECKGSSCSIQGGSLKTSRKNKSKTQKRRK